MLAGVFGAFLASASAATCGDFGQYLSCGNSQIVTSLATSGEDHDCGGSCAFLMGCAAMPSNPHLVPKNETRAAGSWYCAANGVNVECPTGQVVSGICSSGYQVARVQTVRKVLVLAILPPIPRFNALSPMLLETPQLSLGIVAGSTMGGNSTTRA